ncbi:MAG: hypothetical protein M5R36_28005 [Deltaproteobacteria bacterium]|nr:hypothetical protein [Deltaproteobacteria bacterium]
MPSSKITLNIAFLVAMSLFSVMLFVFFACGDDDDDNDDDGGGDDDTNLSADECAALRDRAIECIGTVFDEWVPSVLNIPEACLTAWCEGAGYDVIGELSYYDFKSSCIPVDCETMYDIEFGPGGAYDDCRSHYWWSLPTGPARCLYQ